MGDLDALKSEARRAEARGDYERAARLYLRAVSTAETDDTLPDPGLLIRVGDLEHRQGDPEAALDYYRRAVDLYAEQGLLTNAVAVCNKILRVFPERHEAQARLAELHLDMGLTADARRHILQYDDAADGASGEAGDGRGAPGHLRSFLEREADQEVAVRLADRLEERGRSGEALELLESVARERVREGREIGGLEKRAREIEPAVDTGAWRRPELEVRERRAEQAPVASGADGSPDADRSGLGELGVLGEIVGEPASAGDVVELKGARPGHLRGPGDDRAHLGVLQTLARLVEHRDYATEWHAERVGELSARLAEKLGLPPEAVEMTRDAAPLHDIGMVVVPDRVLLKEGDLTEEERAIMRSHADNGARILSASDLPVMRLAGEIARTHHEQWDGGGYPRGLEGDEIPLSGRIVAVADAFEAAIHDRPYRRATSVEDTLEEIRDHAGVRYDPRVVDALMEVQEDLAEEGGEAGGLLEAL